MKTRLTPAALAVWASVGLGCAVTQDADPQVPWSTREHSASATPSPSALGRGGGEPSLGVTPLPAPGDPDALRSAAIARLRAAMDSDSPMLRANAIEGLQNAAGALDEAVRIGLADPNRGVRFVAAMTVGSQRRGDLARLLEPLLLDDSQSVRAAAIYGFRRNGRLVDPAPLADMLQSADPEVKANAAMVLGELGERSALPMLRAARGRGLARVAAARARIVDLQIAEAMVKLGATEELDGIRAALFVPPEQGELTALACQICGRTGDRAAVSSLLDLALRTGSWQQSPEVRMAATSALAELDPGRAPVEVPRAFLDHTRPELRAQATLTLGAIGAAEGLSDVTTKLRDPSPMVQVAAAAAILRIVPE